MIPFLDLRRQYQAIQDEIDQAVARVLESGWFVLGPEVAAFEEEFARYCGAAHAVGVGNGTDALRLSLQALDIGPGDEVITTPLTATYTALAISDAGATPTFCDIDPQTYNLDPEKLEAAITPYTRAVMPVHLYGQCADMEPILEVCQAHGLKVVEDACQAHGATYRGRKVDSTSSPQAGSTSSPQAGTLGDAGCFSFYPTKNLGAYGDGGLVVTDDEGVAERVRLLRNGGQSDRYHHQVLGINSRLDELQAAVLRVKLRHLEEWVQQRRRWAALYDELLAGSGVEVPVRADYAEVRLWRGEHVYHLYVVRTPERERLQARLRERGVETLVHYPVPVHLQPAYRHLGLGPGSFPEAERAAAEVLSLPMYPELTEEEVRAVAVSVRSFGG